MDKNQKVEWLNQILKKEFKKDFSVTLDTNIEYLQLDSLDLVELQMAYEEEFGIEVPEVSTPFVTVDDLIKILP